LYLIARCQQSGWPTAFHPPRAKTLGFATDRSIDEIVRAHIDDQLGGKYAAYFRGA
jgi:D-erythronate 2-dehydrogenase